MTLRHALRAALALALGSIPVLATPARAVDVDAATFLAGCPGPIFITSDTTLVGTATVGTGCALATPIGVFTPGAQINMRNAKLSFAGGFSITGFPASVTVEDSKLESTSIVLDSASTMTIMESTLAAGDGGMNLTPRSNLAISDSRLVTTGGVTLGGPGGLRDLTDSEIDATGAILIAGGGSPAGGANLLRSTLSSDTSIELGGVVTAGITIVQSSVVARGVGTAIRLGGSGGAVREVTGSKLMAPAGAIHAVGTAGYVFEDTKVQTGAGPGGVGIMLGSSTFATCRRSQLKALRSAISTTGTGGVPVFEDCRVQAGGTSGADGIMISGAPVITRTLLQASTGGMIIQGAGVLTVERSTLQARGASGIRISGLSAGRTIDGSRLDAAAGAIDIRGAGDTVITRSKLFARNAGGILLTGSSDSHIDDSQLVTLGLLRIPNGGGSVVVSSNVQADGGFITETGGGGPGDSTVSGNIIKASSVTVRSFNETTVTVNKMAAGAFEFSSTGTCTSAGNSPDIPCF